MTRRFHARVAVPVSAALGIAGLICATTLTAQTSPFAEQIGVGARAAAARHIATLSVQQAIAALPPAAPQVVRYEYEPRVDTFGRQELVGPTVFRSAQVMDSGQLGVRAVTSYFEISDRLGPVDYRVGGDYAPQGAWTRLGLDLDVDVALFTIAASYGLGYGLEIDTTVPVVLTDANANQQFLASRGSSETAPGLAVVGGADANAIDALLGTGALELRSKGFNDLGADFPAGTNVGLGRTAIGLKWQMLAADWMQAAFIPEVYLPSPSEDQLAGPDSAAFLPRLVASFPLHRGCHLHLETGYNVEVDGGELNRFVWAAGVSLPLSRVGFDVGVNGSQYEHGIEWTPHTAVFTARNGLVGTLTTDADNRLGTTFADFMLGFKLRLSEHWLASGAVSVPLTSDGIRPAATGTIAVELLLPILGVGIGSS